MARSVCAVCFSAARSRCSKCRERAYCSRECQTSDFPWHRKECGAARKLKLALAACRAAGRATLALQEEDYTTCPVCYEKLNFAVEREVVHLMCCRKLMCLSCLNKIPSRCCPMCREPPATTAQKCRAHLEGAIKNQNCSFAQYLLSLELGDGRSGRERQGFERDPERALELLRLSAGQGNPAAQNKLARDYLDAAGDLSEAVCLWTMAAEQGNSKAQYELAGCYWNGEGVPRDVDEALRLYALSANQNNADAVGHLKRVRPLISQQRWQKAAGLTAAREQQTN